LRTARRMRQTYFGETTGRVTGQHVARFFLVAAYTGTRATPICNAALDQPTIGRSWIDLKNGIFYRQAVKRRKKKNKQQTPVRLPPRLLAHMRRWKRKGLAIHSLIEWNGAPVKRINKAFRSVARAAGLADVTPHTLRHTCATWLAQRGVPTWEAAGFLGMTEPTFVAIYGHHHPDYQARSMRSDRPDSFRTVSPQPNVNRRHRMSSESPADVELLERLTRSGRGGRRFKSCHSDQLHTSSVDLSQLIGKSIELGNGRVHKRVHRRVVRMAGLTQDSKGNYITLCTARALAEF